MSWEEGVFLRAQNTSFRKKWRRDCLRILCGFANAKGGTLYIGMNENGTVTGLSPGDCRMILDSVPETVLRELRVRAAAEVMEEREHKCVRVMVHASGKPVSYEGRYYYRSGGTTIRLDGDSLAAFLLERNGNRWENAPLPAMKDRDISSRAAEAYRSAAADTDTHFASDAEYVRSLGLAENGCYTNAAALMFTDHPEYWVIGAIIKIGFFDDDGNTLRKEDVRGPILEQADTAAVEISAKYSHVYAAPFPFPEAAVKEAVLNAVIHKDYATGDPIQVRCGRDSLRVLNSGSLPEGWTTETLAGIHLSQPRNPAIADLFERAGRASGWGTGAEKMEKACEKAGLPAPRYSVSGFGLSVEITASGEGGA